MNDQLIILKLGGAAITEKGKVKIPNEETISNVAKALQEYGDKRPPMILVHGAGSYGHPFAYKYKLMEGIVEDEVDQVSGLVETHMAVGELHGLIMAELVAKGLPVISFPPHTCFFYSENGWELFIDPLILSLKIGLIPVLHGDISFRSDSRIFSILSGDVIIQELARHFKPSDVLYGTNVDGLFSSDPNLDSQAELILELTHSELSVMLKNLSQVHSSNKDVTSGIKGKIEAILNITNMGVPAMIFNLCSEECLTAFFKGEKIKGTRFLPR